MHLCRGNAGDAWLTSGSIEPVAEQMFSLPYDTFLVEWDDKAREGDYSALRRVPQGTDRRPRDRVDEEPGDRVRGSADREIEDAANTSMWSS